MLAENRLREVVKLRLVIFAPILLGVFTSDSSLDYLIAFAVDTCHRLAKMGEMEALKKSFS